VSHLRGAVQHCHRNSGFQQEGGREEKSAFCLIGWLLERFRRWLDLQPNIDLAQLLMLQRFGRPSFGIGVSLCILAPLLWLIWR
jgi:hypothetical protein